MVQNQLWIDASTPILTFPLRGKGLLLPRSEGCAKVSSRGKGLRGHLLKGKGLQASGETGRVS